MDKLDAAWVKKILRLLEGEHDGEVLSAAHKLAAIAAENGQNLDELMAAVYGGGWASYAGPSFGSAEWRRAYQNSPEWPTPPRRSRTDAPLDKLKAATDEFGTLPLTAWEVSFVTDILARSPMHMSERQEEVIARILQKYERQSRNESSFWGR